MELKENCGIPSKSRIIIFHNFSLFLIFSSAIFHLFLDSHLPPGILDLRTAKVGRILVELNILSRLSSLLRLFGTIVFKFHILLHPRTKKRRGGEKAKNPFFFSSWAKIVCRKVSIPIWLFPFSHFHPFIFRFPELFASLASTYAQLVLHNTHSFLSLLFFQVTLGSIFINFLLLFHFQITGHSLVSFFCTLGKKLETVELKNNIKLAKRSGKKQHGKCFFLMLRLSWKIWWEDEDGKDDNISSRDWTESRESYHSQ